MNAWIKRGACVGAVSAGLLTAAAASASAATHLPDSVGAPVPAESAVGLPSAIGPAGTLTVLAIGRGGNGGPGGDDNTVRGNDNRVANGGSALTGVSDDAIPVATGDASPATAAGGVREAELLGIVRSVQRPWLPALAKR